jgi:hypothetical protein
MKKILLNLFFSFLLCAGVIASELETTKQSCVNMNDYKDKNLADIKEILIKDAKRNAVSEFFGEIVRSTTIVKDFELQTDKITSEGLGMIRVKGDPIFYNGKNLGEVCVELKAFISEDDIEKFKPEKVEIKKYCYSNPNLPVKVLKDKALQDSYLEIIKRKNPMIKNIDQEDVSRLIYNFTIANESFDFNTGSYCMDVSGMVIPFMVSYYTNNNVNKVKKDNGVLKYNSFILDPQKYQMGDLLYDFSETAIIMESNKYNGGKVIGTNDYNMGYINIKNLEIKGNISLDLDVYSDDSPYVISLTTCDNQNLLLSATKGYNPYLYVFKFPNGLEIKDIRHDGYKYDKITILISEDNVYKLFLNGSPVGSYRSKEPISCIGEVSLSVSRGVYYGKIEIKQK